MLSGVLYKLLTVSFVVLWFHEHGHIGYRGHFVVYFIGFGYLEHQVVVSGCWAGREFRLEE